MAEELTRGRWKGARAFSRRLEACSKDSRYEFSYNDGFYGFVRVLGDGYVVRIAPREYRYPEGKVSVSLWHENWRIKSFPDVALSRIMDTADALAKIAHDPVSDFSRTSHYKWGKALY